ncbi:MAG: hypothetical protein KDC46_14420 [Thermoleophilia bacterium]|nr:hypothetical protein [Thermoleophilia bacterium]
MAASETTPRPTHAQLLEMLEAPDLTRRERRELQRMARFQKRVETWEHRRANPAPAKLHRAVITLLMMAACLWVLWLLLGGGAPA